MQNVCMHKMVKAQDRYTPSMLDTCAIYRHPNFRAIRVTIKVHSMSLVTVRISMK
jgi:hypothetical protein